MYRSLQSIACPVISASINNSISKVNDVSKGELAQKFTQIKNSSINHRSQLWQTPMDEQKYKASPIAHGLDNTNLTKGGYDNRTDNRPDEKKSPVDVEPQSINNLNKEPNKKNSFADSIMAARLKLNKVDNSTQVKQNLSNGALLSELTARLEKINNDNVCGSHIVINSDVGPSKIALEIARLREEYEREAPKRAEAEAKEELRVAMAVDLEKKESAGQKINSEASDELVQPVIIEFDERGIPLPPPLPPMQSINQTKIKIEPKVNSVSSRQSAEPLSVSLFKELSAKLMKRNNDNLLEIKKEKTDGEANNKIALEIAKLREEYEREAPKRAEAEAKEELRVAMAEMKEREEEVLTRKVSSEPLPFVDIKYDDRGIPIPPPLPMVSKK